MTTKTMSAETKTNINEPISSLFNEAKLPKKLLESYLQFLNTDAGNTIQKQLIMFFHNQKKPLILHPYLFTMNHKIQYPHLWQANTMFRQSPVNAGLFYRMFVPVEKMKIIYIQIVMDNYHVQAVLSKF